MAAGLLGNDDSNGLLGLVDAMNQVALGPTYVPRDPPQTATVSAGTGPSSAFDIPEPTGGRSLPTNNYRTSLSTYAPTLYRQASASEVPDYIPGMRLNDKRFDEPYFADHPTMALGQGENANGVLLAFDAAPIQGQVNTSKPSFAPSWQNGYGEYRGTKNTQQDYQQALSALRIPTDLQMSRLEATQMLNVASRLQNAGWSSQAGPGYTEYQRPGTEP
jgi:hypothetical protein